MIRSLRSKIAVALLSFGLLAGSVGPVAAAPVSQIVIGGQLHPFQCYKNGTYYAVGSTLPAGPLFYWKCEMGWVTDGLGIPHYEAVWKVYPRT